MSWKEIEYGRVEGENHHSEHDNSSTDVESPLTGRPTQSVHGKEWDEFDHAPPHRRESPSRGCCSPRTMQGLINTILLLVIVALLLDRRWSRDDYRQFEGSGDITGFIPPVSQRITTFVPDMAFAPDNGSEFFTDAVQQKWLSIVPKGLGYLHMEDPSRYNNLPHPLKGYEEIGTVFTTSVTHQLHCLYNILEVYSSIKSGKRIAPQMEGHLPHCFEYLRQSIMCCGDTAIEGQHTTFPHGILGSDGWDAKHVCKDYDQVYAFLEEHRADDQVWI